MMCYSIEPKDRLFVKGYGVLSVTKNIAQNLGKKIIKTALKKQFKKHQKQRVI